MIRRDVINAFMKAADIGIQLFMQSYQRHLFSIRSTTFYTQQISLLIDKQIFLDFSITHWNNTGNYVLYLLYHNAEGLYSVSLTNRILEERNGLQY